MRSLDDFKFLMEDHLDAVDSKNFSIELFKLCGIFIVRSAFQPIEVMNWQKAWKDFSNSYPQRNVNQFNPPEVLEELSPELLSITKQPKILDILEQIMGPEIGLFRARFMVKDKNARNRVHLHDDFCYQIGWPHKASVFLALSEVNELNGGLRLYLGTSKFGYLGDAGEINKELLGENWPSVAPSLMPGDFVIMASTTWHESSPYVSGPDRVITDFIYQPADDFSTKEIVRGKGILQKTFMNTHSDGTLIKPTEKTMDLHERFFMRSRISKLKELQQKINAFEKLES